MTFSRATPKAKHLSIQGFDLRSSNSPTTRALQPTTGNTTFPMMFKQKVTFMEVLPQQPHESWVPNLIRMNSEPELQLEVVTKDSFSRPHSLLQSDFRK